MVMPLSRTEFSARLDRWVDAYGRPPRILLAFSGGRDSSVLLHLLSHWVQQSAVPVEAVHINHQLHEAASSWQAHCEQQAGAVGIPIRSVQVSVALNIGHGLEASARAARYAALQQALQPGDWLFTAHHADDQAETVLLNLMRGSGVTGVRGIARSRSLGEGTLWRPLLDIPVADIDRYARSHAIHWIDDHTNSDLQHDRNFLRAEVMPVLCARWPAMATSMTRSAAHASEASELLDELAAQDLLHSGEAGRLSQSALQNLGPARCRNLIRHACRRLQLPTPPFRQLRAIQDELMTARDDAMPSVCWSGAEARRFQGHLYLLAAHDAAEPPERRRLDPETDADLGRQLGTLRLRTSDNGGIREAVAAAGLAVRFRQGGERLRPAGHAQHRRLKSLLQEAGVVPWMRDRIPLLYAAEELVAVADLWVAAEFHEARGFHVYWQQRPAIF